MPTREDWAVAYHRQGRSDWTIRFRDTSAEAAALLTSHVGFPRFLNPFLLSPQMREEYDGRHAQLESIRAQREGSAEKGGVGGSRGAAG